MALSEHTPLVNGRKPNQAIEIMQWGAGHAASPVPDGRPFGGIDREQVEEAIAAVVFALAFIAGGWWAGL